MDIITEFVFNRIKNIISIYMDITTNYTDKLNTYKTQFDSIIDDYKKYYILTNKNPEYQEYSKFFSMINNNLTTINKDLFIISNDIQRNTDILNNQINILDEKMISEKDIYKKLSFALKQKNGRNNSSFVMIDESIDLYKRQYISNWNIIIGILLLSFFSLNIIRKRI